MALNFQNFATLVSNMAASVQANATALLDLSVGSVLRAILEANASIALWLQWLIAQVLARSRLATSYGADCDSFCGDFGFLRLGAVAATGYVTFGRYTATSSAFLAVGSQVRTADGTETFTVLADPTNALWNGSNGFLIPAGTSTGLFLVQALNLGSQGNVLANTISQVVGSIAGIDYCNNAVGFTNGANAESDAAMKARFANWASTRALGTQGAILYAATSAALGLTATITYGVPIAGTFTVYVDDGSGNPPAATLSAVSAAVNAVRAFSITAFVQGPSLVVAAVAGTLTVAPGVSKPALIPIVQQAITAFINALPMGSVLPYSRLAQVIYDAAPGITNISGLLLNGATADLGGGASQVVRSGAVNIS